MNNFRQFEYLDQLILESYEGDGEDGMTLAGTELAPWLELPSPWHCTQHVHGPILCKKDYCYL